MVGGSEANEQPAVQQKVLSLFHFSLNRGGVLVLGPSESPGPLARGFEALDRHWQIYRKQSGVRTPVETRLQTPASTEPRGAGGATAPAPTVTRHALGQLLGPTTPCWTR